jgi:hypothetical protein
MTDDELNEFWKYAGLDAAWKQQAREFIAAGDAIAFAIYPTADKDRRDSGERMLSKQALDGMTEQLRLYVWTRLYVAVRDATRDGDSPPNAMEVDVRVRFPKKENA